MRRAGHGARGREPRRAPPSRPRSPRPPRGPARRGPLTATPWSPRARTAPGRRSRAHVGRAMSLGVAIVGCGLIGHKRAQALAAGLVACADVQRERADALARTGAGVTATDDWRAAVDRDDVDIVIVATTNDALAAVRAPRSRPASTCWSRSRPRASVAELDARDRGGRAAAARWSASASTIAITRRCRRPASSFDAGALGDADVHPRPLRPRRPPRLREGVARRSGALRRRRADRSGRAPDRSRRAGSSATSRRSSGFAAHLLLGHAGRRQRVPAAADGRRPDRVAARQLHRVEEPVLARDLRPRRQAADRRPRRQLRRRAADVLPDAAGDGPAGDDRSGSIPRGDRSWALEFAEFLDDIRLDRAAVARARRRARRARGRRGDLPQSGYDFVRRRR